MPAFSTEIKNHYRASARENNECLGKNRVDCNLRYHDAEITGLTFAVSSLRNYMKFNLRLKQIQQEFSISNVKERD